MSYLKTENIPGNEDVVRCLTQEGIMSIRNKIPEIEKMSAIDLMLVGHNLHTFMIDVALRSMGENKDEKTTETDYYKLWLSAIDTLLENTIGIDYYVNHVISDRTDAYIEEMTGEDDQT